MTNSALQAAEPKPKSPLKSKTFWFSVLGAAIHVISDYKNPMTWGEGASIVGAAYGVREAISKNGVGI